MIHAYCIRREGEPGPPQGLEGVEGAPVRLLPGEGLALWVSEEPARRPTPERIRAHDRVIRTALRTATPIPIRYGAGSFHDERAAVAALRERHEEFTRTLERVAGRVEMGIRVGWSPPAELQAEPDPAPPRPPGRAYLEARGRELRRGEALRNAAAATLDRVAREIGLEELPATRRVLAEPATAGSLAHLVQKLDLRGYREQVERARLGLPECTLTLSGPWPPYSFV